MDEDSDIDILLIRPEEADAEQWEGEIHDLTQSVRRWTGNPVEILQLTEADVRGHGTEPVLREVVQDGLTFAGEPTWLRRGIRTPGGPR